MQAAAEELRGLECLPFAGFVTDPCDGRTQGTVGMMDSLPYRNDAAQVFRRLIRSLPDAPRRPRRRHVRQGPARDDDGARRRCASLPCVLVPGGVTLPARDAEDAGTVQSIGARFAHGEITLERAADMGCRACGSAGRRLPVPRHRGDVPGRRRGARPRPAPLRPGAVGPADLAGRGPAIRARAGRARGARAHRRATSSPTPPCGTP